MNDRQVTYEVPSMPRVADPLARSRLLRAAREVFARVGLAEARVVELRDLVQEQREQLSRALLDNTRIGEDR